MFAKQQVAALMEIKDSLEAAGVALVTIGSGNPEQAKKFVKSFYFTGEMYVDSRLTTYKAFNLNRGITRTLGPSSIKRGLSAMKEGFRQGKSAGDLWQQGGMFVIDPDSQPGSQMLFAHRNRAAGDQADLNAVLKVVRT